MNNCVEVGTIDIYVCVSIIEYILANRCQRLFMIMRISDYKRTVYRQCLKYKRY